MGDGGIYLKVKVVPKSAVTKIVGWEGDLLKIKIAAPPEKGKANSELLRFLAKTLSASKSNFEIVSGETSRLKKILIKNVSQKSFDQFLVIPYNP